MFSLQSSPPPSGAAGETLRADAAAPSHLYGARCLHALSTLPQPAGVQDPAAATAPSQRQTSLAASTDSARITRFNNENEAQADALNFGQSSGWKLASSDEHSVLWQSLDSRL
ncbi:uncharacterized protein [Zea mays]|uniref:uncharacterized protein isoform X2 n=1 Tax=Zea mays TaxID=4577 RepID=UPI001653212C|nr:uncharacterized protein LOC109941936 isoform X2 [Zea mays]